MFSYRVWVLSLLPLLTPPGLAQAQFNYATNNGTITITGYTGAGGAETVPDTIRVLSVMDLFVLSSIHEGLGLAILEALSCGLPVVASDTGGIYSIIKDNVTGLLVPPRDPEALAGAIIKVLSNKEWAGQLALAGKKFVSENFSLDEMARRVQTVYQGAAV